MSILKNGVDNSPINNPVGRSRKRNVKINSCQYMMATSGTVQRRQSMRAGVFDESVEHWMVAGGLLAVVFWYIARRHVGVHSVDSAPVSTLRHHASPPRTAKTQEHYY